MKTRIRLYVHHVSRLGRDIFSRKKARSRRIKCEDGKKRKLLKISFHDFVRLVSDGLRFALWARTKKRPIAHRVPI